MSYTESELSQIWEELYPKVYGYFFRRVNNRINVEDLAATTLTAYLQNLVKNGDLITNKMGFLWKIAHNQLLVFIRQKSKTPVFVGINDNFDSKDVDLEIENHSCEHLKQKIEHLLECVKKNLKASDLEIVNLIVGDDMKAVIVAQKLQVTPEVVRQRFSRSLKKLRQKCQNIWDS